MSPFSQRSPSYSPYSPSQPPEDPQYKVCLFDEPPHIRPTPSSSQDLQSRIMFNGKQLEDKMDLPTSNSGTFTLSSGHQLPYTIHFADATHNGTAMGPHTETIRTRAAPAETQAPDDTASNAATASDHTEAPEAAHKHVLPCTLAPLYDLAQNISPQLLSQTLNAYATIASVTSIEHLHHRTQSTLPGSTDIDFAVYELMHKHVVTSHEEGALYLVQQAQFNMDAHKFQTYFADLILEFNCMMAAANYDTQYLTANAPRVRHYIGTKGMRGYDPACTHYLSNPHRVQLEMATAHNQAHCTWTNERNPSWSATRSVQILRCALHKLEDQGNYTSNAAFPHSLMHDMRCFMHLLLISEIVLNVHQATDVLQFLLLASGVRK